MGWDDVKEPSMAPSCLPSSAASFIRLCALPATGPREPGTILGARAPRAGPFEMITPAPNKLQRE